MELKEKQEYFMRVLCSCKTEEQIKSCESWSEDLYKRGIMPSNIFVDLMSIVINEEE